MKSVNIKSVNHVCWVFTSRVIPYRLELKKTVAYYELELMAK